MSTTDLHTADPVDVEETAVSGHKTRAHAKREEKRDEKSAQPQQGLKIWIDGKLVDRDEARLSVYDHGVLYGDGVFEGIRVYNGRIFECDAHLERLYLSARAIRLEIPIPRDKFKAAMEQTIRANDFTDCYIRAVVTRGVGTLGWDPLESTCRHASLSIL